MYVHRFDERARSAVVALLYATGESQTELAAALGVSQVQVSRRRSGTAAWSRPTATR